jgi:uncharacterized protein (TIGR02145 family)
MYSPPILDFNNETNKGTLFDTRDGQAYHVVKIGEQIWLAENFRYEPSKEKGDKYVESCIPTPYTLNAPKDTGRYYDLNTANNIAPEGWRLPSKEDFDILVDFIEKDNMEGYNPVSNSVNQLMTYINNRPWGITTYLKSKDLWEPSGDLNANDKYGFTLKPTGYVESVTDISTLNELKALRGYGKEAILLTDTNRFRFHISYYSSVIDWIEEPKSNSYYKNFQYNVRLIKE